MSQKIHCQERPSSDRAADERAEGDGEAPDPAPGAEGDAAPLGRDGRVRIVSVSGVTIAPPTPWIARAATSTPDRGRERGRGRGGREDCESDDEHSAPPEAVAERGAGEQEDREWRV